MLAARGGRLVARALKGPKYTVLDDAIRSFASSSQFFVDRPVSLLKRFRAKANHSFGVLGTPGWLDDRDEDTQDRPKPSTRSLYSGGTYPSFSTSHFRFGSHRVGSHQGPNRLPIPIAIPGHSAAYFSTESSMQTKASAQDVPPIVERPNMGRHQPLGKTRIPTPASKAAEEADPLNTIRKTTPKRIINTGLNGLVSVFKTVVTFLLKLPGNIFFYMTHPKELSEAMQNVRDIVVHEAKHYWVGTKLLWADMQTARHLLGKTLSGSTLTRRERKQLLRTVSDLFRLIPFSMFVLIPFMEFALPFALRIFPNMLPSTYQDSLKAEENMKRELKSRIAMAQFFQETLEELAKEQKRKASKRKKELEDAGEGDSTIEAQKDSAQSMLEFLEKARSGEMMSQDVIVKYANYFKDDLTLDNMPRMQLIGMCKYMGIQPYGSDAFLRFQLRHKIRVLKEDDQRILWEGIDSLTKMELREACQERGMRSTGLSKEAYKRSLQQWLDLSVNKDLPIALLIMSRVFFLKEETFQSAGDNASQSLSGLADAMSGMQKEIVNEVILEVATEQEKKSHPDVRKIKLEVLSQQNELIRAEEEARRAAAKKKEVAEKEKEATEKGKEAAERGKEAAAEKKKEAAEKDLIEAVEAPPSLEVAPDISVSSKPEVTVVPTMVAEPVQPSEIVAPEEPEVEKEEDKHHLSAEEMDAISQLLSDDPVIKEREDLEKIKAAIKSGKDIGVTATTVLTESVTDATPTIDAAGAKTREESAIPTGDLDVKIIVAEAERAAADEAAASTKITLDAHLDKSEAEAPKPEVVEEEDIQDPVVARLQKRLKSMVDKIEVQLSETQVKIGDKLHVLDKDSDGLLSREEMAEVLQQVLKRKISHEEALEIADTMDSNQDGFFTVEELVQWIDEHKLVKFVEEGRDADMDKMMESHKEKAKHEDPTPNELGKESSSSPPPS